MLVKGFIFKKKKKLPRRDGCCQELLAWRRRMRRRETDLGSDDAASSASDSIVKHLRLRQRMGIELTPLFNGLVVVEGQMPTPTVALAFISDFSVSFPVYVLLKLQLQLPTVLWFLFSL